MAVWARTTAASAWYSAGKRMLVARMVLALGWLALAASLPMVMNYVPGGTVWNPGPLKPEYTWAVVHWYVRSADLLRKLLLAPYIVGLAAGTLAVVLPSRIFHRGLVWVCRLVAVGACEALGLGLLWEMVNHFDPNVRGGFGGGFLFCGVGSLLISLSAWIRPVCSGSESENGKQSTASNANPSSGMGRM